PFLSAAHIYATIDQIYSGGTPWECLKVSSNITEYEVWYHNVDHVLTEIFNNSDFKDKFDYHAFTYTDQQGQRWWLDFMSGNYAWGQSDKIYADDHSTDDAMYCGIILSSDKTTISVTTGNIEYHSLYLSITNPHNSVCRVHNQAVVPIAFIVIPKGMYYVKRTQRKVLRVYFSGGTHEETQRQSKY
ncbi:hypothetical protein HD554DRAFT_2010478, partial [Boletus coccyginus]